MKAQGESFVNATLRRQGIKVAKIKKESVFGKKGKVSEKDVTLFTRQLALVQVINVLVGRTTSERFGFKAKNNASSEEEEQGDRKSVV